MRRSLCGGILALALLALAGRLGGARRPARRSSRLPIARSSSTSSAPRFPIRAKASSDRARGLLSVRQGQERLRRPRRHRRSAAGDDDVILLGGDFRTRVLSYSESFPLDGSLTLGLGANFGDGDDRLPAARRPHARPALRSRRLEHDASRRTFTRRSSPSSAAASDVSSRSVSASTFASASAGRSRQRRPRRHRGRRHQPGLLALSSRLARTPGRTRAGRAFVHARSRR